MDTLSCTVKAHILLGVQVAYSLLHFTPALGSKQRNRFSTQNFFQGPDIRLSPEIRYLGDTAPAQTSQKSAVRKKPDVRTSGCPGTTGCPVRLYYIYLRPGRAGEVSFLPSTWPPPAVAPLLLPAIPIDLGLPNPGSSCLRYFLSRSAFLSVYFPTSWFRF